MYDKDFQRSKVYAWEHEIVRPKLRDEIPFSQAQSLVNHVWAAERLQFPPIVEPLDKRTTKWAGKGNRLGIWLPAVTSTHTILHELAHSATSTFEGDSAWHCPLWVGYYCRILEKYANMNLLVLYHTLDKAGIKFLVNASPVFLD